MTTPYEDLGVPPTASKETIKRAYRKKAQKAHPDKGGNEAEFKKLATSYALLSDDAARKRFDETGSTAPEPPDILLGELAGMLCRILDNADHAGSVDVIELMRKDLARNKQAVLLQKATVDRAIRKMNDAKSRLKVADGHPNDLGGVLEVVALGLANSLKAADAQVDRITRLTERLKDYSYRADYATQANPFGMFRYA